MAKRDDSVMVSYWLHVTITRILPYRMQCVCVCVCVRACACMRVLVCVTDSCVGEHKHNSIHVEMQLKLRVYS